MLFRIYLSIGGIEIAVAGASISAPESVLGFSITCALAQRTPGVVAANSPVTLKIGIKEKLSDTYVYVPIITDGRLLGREYTVVWEEGSPGKPGDTLSFNALSPFSDRWSLAPLIPVIMYNPDFVAKSTLQVDPRTAPRNPATGQAYLPVLEPVKGLGIRTAMDRAYTGLAPFIVAGSSPETYQRSQLAGTGCGFRKVVTNLPDFPVDRIDFTQTGGYHSAIAGLIAMFEPIYFELDNVLYIIDPSRGMPPAMPVRDLHPDCIGEVIHTVEPSQIVNAILLTYTVRNNSLLQLGYIPSPRIKEDEPLIAGNVRTEVTHTFTDWKDLSTGLLAYSEETQTETRVYLQGGAPDGADILLSLEVMEVEYQGRLKVGHTKTTSAYVPNPDIEWPDNDNPPPDKIAQYTFVDNVHQETCQIEWGIDAANTGQSTMQRCVTQTSGICVVETRDDGVTIYTPILDAAKSQIIKGDGSQHTTRKRIDTVIEELKQTGYNQAQMVARIIHEISKTIETPPVTNSRTGTPSTASGGGARRDNAITVQELLTLPASIAQYGMRRAASLNAGLLNPVDARALALVKLNRLSVPRRHISVRIPNGIDFLIHRGSVIRAPLRDGSYEARYMVTGYKVTLQGLLTPSPAITHAIEAVEIG